MHFLPKGSMAMVIKRSIVLPDWGSHGMDFWMSVVMVLSGSGAGIIIN
jgi:hypothetical protein